MGAHHRPVDVLRHAVEEGLVSSVLQVGEETSDIVGLNRHSASPFGFFLSHRALAALRAISLRCSAVSFSARALPPFFPPSLPSSTAAGFFSCKASRPLLDGEA